jgi:CarD family transcriptional regulator
MTFQIGEKVMYPNHGVATVENISSRTLAGQFQRYYLLRLAYQNMTVMVPTTNAESVGLRKVSRTSEMSKVLEYLSEKRCIRSRDWKDRFRENSEKMQHGNLLAIAEVLKGLLLQQIDKPLSFRERKMLDRARHMLTSELCTARGLKECDAAKSLGDALAKANLQLPEPL